MAKKTYLMIGKCIIIILLILFVLFIRKMLSRTNEEEKVIVRCRTMEYLRNDADYDPVQMNDITVKYDEGTGYTELENSGDIYVHNAFDALNVLGRFRDMLHIDSMSFACEGVSEDDNRTVYTMGQMYRDVPVYGYGFRVAVGEDGRLISVDGRYADDISCMVEYRMSPREVREIIAHEIEINSYELMVYRFENSVSRSMCYSVPMWYLDISRDGRSGYVLFNGANGLIINIEYF